MQATSSVPLETTVLGTIAVVLLAGTLIIPLVMRLGQPPVVGEILAGLILGPSVLGLLPGDLVSVVFPSEIRPYLNAIAQVGLVLFMFITGWELDPITLRRQGRTIAATSVSAMALPFGLGILGAMLLYPDHQTVNGETVRYAGFLLYIGTALAITAFPVLARLLSDKGMQSTRLGSLSLACAAAGDVLAWCLLVVVVIVLQSSGMGSLFLTLGGTIAFLLICAFILRPTLAALVRRGTTPGSSIPLFVAVSVGVLLCSYSTAWIGVHQIFGAFVFGLIMPRDPAGILQRAVEVPMRNISTLLLPLFFIVTGLTVDVTGLSVTDIVAGLLLIVLACAGKVVGAMTPARISGMSWRDSVGLGLLMNTRGLTELVVLEVGRQLGVIDNALFTLLTIMALVTTMMTSPFLRILGLVPDRTGTPESALAGTHLVGEASE